MLDAAGRTSDGLVGDLEPEYGKQVSQSRRPSVNSRSIQTACRITSDGNRWRLNEIGRMRLPCKAVRRQARQESPDRVTVTSRSPGLPSVRVLGVQFTIPAGSHDICGTEGGRSWAFCTSRKDARDWEHTLNFVARHPEKGRDKVIDYEFGPCGRAGDFKSPARSDVRR